MRGWGGKWLWRDWFGDPLAALAEGLQGTGGFLEALVGNRWLSNTSDTSKQTPLRERQAVSALAKVDKRCSGRCISGDHQNPSLKWQSWPPLSP